MRLVPCLLFLVQLLVARSCEAPSVEVLVPPVVPSMARVFYHAQGIAAAIYSQIGVEVDWRNKLSRLEHCSIPVIMSWNTPASLHPGAMAFSELYATGGGSITVLLDRLKPMVENNPDASAVLLGHVLAHEMGHILQGIKRHSTTGVLKEQWSAMEIRSSSPTTTALAWCAAPTTRIPGRSAITPSPTASTVPT